MPSEDTRLAAFIAPGRSLAHGVGNVQLAESLGYESAWVVQLADRDATIVCSAYLQGTSQIKIGTGVLPTYPRTPAVAAQTAATLDDLSGGRFILGLGTSHKLTIEHWHGMTLSKPIASTREYVGAVRAIMRGEPFYGEIYRTAFSFMGFSPVRRELPIYISCLSPKMCELAGEVADGAVLWMCSPGYIKDVVVPAIARGRAKSGLTMDGFEIVSAVPVSLSADRAAARDAFRKTTVTYWNLPFYRAAVEGGGFGEDLRRFDAGGPSAISDEVVDAFAGTGSADAAVAAVAAYREAGVTLPAVAPLPRYEGAASVGELLTELAPPR